MAFPGNTYAPPGVYTKTQFETPVAGGLDNFKLPVIMGEGNESLSQTDLEVIRGSSTSQDQRVAEEDETGRSVVLVTPAGVVTLGNFDGVLDKFQVRHYPIVTGEGSGTSTTNRTDVSVTINGQPIVVRAVSGTTGIVQLTQAPQPSDVVRCTYFFKRTDTLITDDVSNQVSNRFATVKALSGLNDVAVGGTDTINLYADVLNGQGMVVVPANNWLLLAVDGVDKVLTIPPNAAYTMAQIASAISALLPASIQATTFVNQYGHSALQLQSYNSLVVKSGAANGVLGFVSGQADKRVSTFYTFNGPIVDGSNGGVGTTDPAHVTVKVDGKQVIPTSVNGATHAVTLPVAPKAGAKVTIQYYFNTWQDTFDYLANIGVTSVTKCGDVPGGSAYVQGADFILQNDKILWGTAVTTETGSTTQGATAFGENQIATTLVDNQTFLAPCVAFVRQSGGIATESHTEFVLPYQPTLGNGRNTLLGQSLFQTVSNGRIDLPVDRPDVIQAYWGFDLQDALNRGKVDVLKVDGLVITLSETVPVGANVYASFYYNTLVDEAYTLAVKNPGVSGVGTYTVQKSGGEDVFVAKFPLSSKTASLTGVTVEFPSGSEMTPDVRLEVPEDTSLFTGPVEEIVSVIFANREASLARFTFPGSGPYEFITGKSDHLALTVHSVVSVDAGGINLSSPAGDTGHVGGYFASLVSDEIVYEGGPGASNSNSYNLAAEQFNVEIDGVDIVVKAGTKTAATVSDVAFAINQAAFGFSGATKAGMVASPTAIKFADANVIGTSAAYNDYYKGWVVVVGSAPTVGGTAGKFRTITAYDAASQVATTDTFTTNVTAGDLIHVYNPATRATLTGTTKFDGPVKIAAGAFDALAMVYHGSVSGSAALALTLPATTYTLTTLLTAINAQIQTALLGAGAGFAGLNIECSANGDSKLQFQIQLAGDDHAGFLQFTTSAPGTDFAELAGLDTAAAEAGGQTTLVHGPVARVKTCTGGTYRLYDRLVLRNRILPGGANGTVDPTTYVAQGSLTVKSSSAHAGLVSGMSSPAGSAAATHPATLYGRVSLMGGQDAVLQQPVVTFYDGTGPKAANNTLTLEVDGFSVPVTFTASDTGTATKLGPIATTSSVLGQLVAALVAVPGNPFGTTAGDVINAKLVRQEGVGIRLNSSRSDTLSRISVTGGTANSLLGLPSGTQALRTTTTAKQVAAALMSNMETSFSSWMHNPASSVASYFADLGIATTVKDATGAEFLYIQDLPAASTDLGTTSNVSVHNTNSDIANALRYTTGLNATEGDGGVGDSALSGFCVQSNVANGSGSANTSALNPSGTGQDGVVGQTYRDLVTGLTFTILPRGWQTDSTGPWVAYPASGGGASFGFTVSKTFTTDANLPNNALQGVELVVANTNGMTVDDTAIVQTYERGGAEPKVGDSYYVSYVFKKQDFSTRFFSKMSSIEKAFGSATPDNPVSLAAYLAILNGAVVVGIKQVPKEAGQNQGSLVEYRNAIDELEGPLPGQIQPDMITMMRGDSLPLFQYLKKSCEIQSSIRYKSERTGLLGVVAGTTPATIGNYAQTLGHTRMRMVYPDMATLDIQDYLGNTKEYLVDGPYMAAALMGSVVSPNVDVATPWTGRRLVGFTQLARQLDAVQQNLVATKGVTVLEDKTPFIRVRHGLTTDMTNILTKLPTIVLIADEVQQNSRSVLEQFVGIKFLPGIMSQIEGRLAMMLKSMVSAQIITAYTGVKANVSADDPTVAEVEAFYSPVFPLLYLVLTFHLRSSL